MRGRCWRHIRLLHGRGQTGIADGDVDGSKRLGAKVDDVRKPDFDALVAIAVAGDDLQTTLCTELLDKLTINQRNYRN